MKKNKKLLPLYIASILMVLSSIPLYFWTALSTGTDLSDVNFLPNFIIRLIFALLALCLALSAKKNNAAPKVFTLSIITTIISASELENTLITTINQIALMQMSMIAQSLPLLLLFTTCYASYMIAHLLMLQSNFDLLKTFFENRKSETDEK